MKNICPNCNYSNVEDAVFCIKCGERLKIEEDRSTANIEILKSIQPGEIIPEVPQEPPTGVAAGLHMINSGQIFWLSGKDKFTIGRASAETEMYPDIDLTPFDAFTQGVSRNHAAIKVRDDGFYISDLGSINGTSVNNRKIVPFQDYRIIHGDVIALGLFRLQLIVTQNKQ